MDIQVEGSGDKPTFIEVKSYPAHINKVEQMARVPGIEDEDLKQLYEEVMNEIDDASGRIGELYAKAEEKLIDIAPTIGEPTCL